MQVDHPSPVHHPPIALLVDRDADTRQMYAEFLRHSAFEIEEAADGRQALAKAITQQPDVIITETRLFGMNGFDLCRLLRSDASTCDTLIVVVTGDVFAADLVGARAAGADVVLTKPCLPHHLAATIARLLAQSRELRARARAIQARVTSELARSDRLTVQASTLQRKHKALSRSHLRQATTAPPDPPPDLRCPTCDGSLHYLRSQIGGVSVKHQEQWDYFECPKQCGTFQYRHRTRRVRRLN